MAMTSGEWVRTVTPIIVLAASGLVGFVRLDARVNAMERMVESECTRSLDVDTSQDVIQRDTQMSVVQIRADIAYIKESLEHTATTQDEILRELRK